MFSIRQTYIKAHVAQPQVLINNFAANIKSHGTIRLKLPDLASLVMMALIHALCLGMLTKAVK